MIRKEMYFKQTSIDEKNYTIYGVFSTQDEDRHGEIVDQSGWILDAFNQNPVILFAHDHYQPAVGQGVGIVVTDIGNGKMGLSGGIKFAAEENPFAMTLFKLYAGRYMRAFSVGFMNSITEYDQENDIITLKENTLYEISCVNVPANAMALAKSKGIEVKVPDQEEETELSDESIEKLSEAISKKIQKEIRADKAPVKKEIKVETPRAKGSKYAARHINKAIRQLLKKKTLINK